MPEGYLKIKESLKKEGKSEEEAQEQAAKIWNKQHPQNPVGKGHTHEEMSGNKRMVDEDRGTSL